MIHLNACSSEFPIKLSISQHRKYFPRETLTYTQHVNIDIRTGENIERQHEVAQELFLILDTSGSMGIDKKLHHAKLAIENIIKNMNSKDKLHLVEYNSISSIVFEDEDNRSFMLEKLQSLHPDGGTNLMAGFDQTKILLDKYSKRPSVKRIFVFSDGEINVGVTDHTALLNEVSSMKKTYEITICSFGVGVSFDEKLMTNIAEYGSGDYFFIRGSESMNKIISIAFKSFQALIGTNAYLKITMKNNARLVDSYGYQFSNEDEHQIISIGDILYNDNMSILLETEIKISENFFEKNYIDYMIVELWMIDIQDKTSKLVSTETILFSLSQNQEELNDLNKLIEYLVRLQQTQRQEKEITQLLKENRKEEAIQMKTGLLEDIDLIETDLSSSSSDLSEFDIEIQDSILHQTKVIKRRAESWQKLADEGASSDELAFTNSQYTSSNSKYRTAYDEL